METELKNVPEFGEGKDTQTSLQISQRVMDELNRRLQKVRKKWSSLEIYENESVGESYFEIHSDIAKVVQEMGLGELDIHGRDPTCEGHESFGESTLGGSLFYLKCRIVILVYFPSEKLIVDGDEDYRTTMGNIKAVLLD